MSVLWDTPEPTEIYVIVAKSYENKQLTYSKLVDN